MFPPGPRSIIPGRVFLQLRRDPLAFLTRITQTYGDISSFSSLGQRYIVLNHPDLAREVLLTQADAFWKGPVLQKTKAILGDGLLTAEGETHKSQRRLMQPAFHAKHVESYTPDILECTRSVLADFRLPSAGELTDIRPLMMQLTLQIAGRTLFGTLLADDTAIVRRAMESLMAGYVRTVVPWGKLLNRIPLPSTLRLAAALRDMDQLIDRIITSRRALENQKSKIENSPPRDLLSTLIAATDEPSPAPGCPAHASARLTDRQLRDQCITILTAGHETTANALTFTLDLLAQHPAEQEKLRATIRIPSAQDSSLIAQDSYVRAVLSESMRLYPPAWTLGRQNQRPITLGGYAIPAKCTILIPQWTLHRDPRFWPDPLTFNPSRWIDATPPPPRFAYIPFSTGPRNCIGESFAWLEMLLVLPLLLSRFRFTLPPDSPPLLLTPAITLRPRNPVILHVIPLA